MRKPNAPFGVCVNRPMSYKRTDARSDRAIAMAISSEMVLLLAWGRAILMQIAHPLVAAGVAEHSVFARYPRLRLYRFYRTVSAMLALLYGSEDAAGGTAQRIRAIHDGVHGKLAVATGVYSGDHPYSAHDPDLLAWVHATLVDSFLLTYEMFITHLTKDEKNAYCREAARVTTRLGIPIERLPQTYPELCDYVDGMFNRGAIAVGPDAKYLAHAVLNPPLPAVAWPVSRFARLVTISLLPESLRSDYGLSLGASERVVLKSLVHVSSRLLPCLPLRVRRWPASFAVPH